MTVVQRAPNEYRVSAHHYYLYLASLSIYRDEDAVIRLQIEITRAAHHDLRSWLEKDHGHSFLAHLAMVVVSLTNR